MANEIRKKYGTAIRFCVAGSFSPADNGTNWTVGSPTDVALTLSAVANAAGRQSLKTDLWGGLSTGPAGFELYGCVDYTGETPTTTGYTAYYLAPSTSTTQANGNVAGNSGGDAAAPDGALGSITLAEMLRQCRYIGALFTHDGAVVQNGIITLDGFPLPRYGQLIVVNNGGDAYEADDVEAHQVLIPFVYESQ